MAHKFFHQSLNKTSPPDNNFKMRLQDLINKEQKWRVHFNEREDGNDENGRYENGQDENAQDERRQDER